MCATVHASEFIHPIDTSLTTSITSPKLTPNFKISRKYQSNRRIWISPWFLPLFNFITTSFRKDGTSLWCNTRGQSSSQRVRLLSTSKMIATNICLLPFFSRRVYFENGLSLLPVFMQARRQPSQQAKAGNVIHPHSNIGVCGLCCYRSIYTRGHSIQRHSQDFIRSRER